MDNNFQKTVNLKDKAEKDRQRIIYGEPEKTKSKAAEIDEVYKPTAGANNGDNLRQISKPLLKNDNSSLIKKVVLVLAVILVLGTVYLMFAHHNNSQPANNSNGQASNWYAVQLDNGDMYYGQIDNTAADPVVMRNVYYDYDQMNKTANGANPTGNLRLVKKGKETYGPSGTMEIYHVKIVSLDLLSSDSKVLKAILDYENKSQ